MREIIGAALRRQRITIVAAVVVGLLTGFAVEAARVAGGPFRLLTLVPLLFLLAVAVRHLGQPPSRNGLRVDEQERSFHAPPRAGLGFLPVLVGFLAYQAVDSWARADGSSLMVALAAFFAVVTVAFAVLFWQRVPGVVLTPDGITHRRHERQWFVPWMALDPAGRVGSPRGISGISLPIDLVELADNGGRWERGQHLVAVRDVDVAPELLAATIRHYLAHPEERAAIGTREGYARLRHALGGGA